MEMDNEEGQAALAEKLRVFLAAQRRIVTDFERSVAGARHFLELANLAMEREPEQTVSMLEQIREIDLAGHLETQFDTFESMEQELAAGAGMENTRDTEWEELRDRYRQLLQEAGQQTLAAETLLHAIQGNA